MLADKVEPGAKYELNDNRRTNPNKGARLKTPSVVDRDLGIAESKQHNVRVERRGRARAAALERVRFRTRC